MKRIDLMIDMQMMKSRIKKMWLELYRESKEIEDPELELLKDRMYKMMNMSEIICKSLEEKPEKKNRKSRKDIKAIEYLKEMIAEINLEEVTGQHERYNMRSGKNEVKNIRKGDMLFKDFSILGFSINEIEEALKSKNFKAEYWFYHRAKKEEIKELYCRKCGIIKPVSEFYRGGNTSIGYRKTCKECYKKK